MLSPWFTDFLDALPLVHSFLNCSPIGYFWNEKGCSSYTFPREVSTDHPLVHTIISCSPFGNYWDKRAAHYTPSPGRFIRSSYRFISSYSVLLTYRVVLYYQAAAKSSRSLLLVDTGLSSAALTLFATSLKLLLILVADRRSCSILYFNLTVHYSIKVLLTVIFPHFFPLS